jgi:hypothetical protein
MRVQPALSQLYKTSFLFSRLLFYNNLCNRVWDVEVVELVNQTDVKAMEAAAQGAVTV